MEETMMVKMNELVMNLSDLGALTGMNLMALKKKLESVPISGTGPKGSTLYNLKAALQAIYVHGDDSLSALRLQREKAETRLAEAKAIKVELENAASEKTLIPMAEAQKMFGDLVGSFRTKMLAIPSKAAFVVANMKSPGQIETHLKELICEALDALSQLSTEATSGSDEESAKSHH
jgi:phage terminase Nu1 subunit (DNA packaging protein)